MTTEQKLLRMTTELWNAFIASTMSSPFDKDNKDDVNDFRRCINDMNRIIATRTLYDADGFISLQKIELLEPDKPFKPGPKPKMKKRIEEHNESKSKHKDEELE